MTVSEIKSAFESAMSASRDAGEISEAHSNALIILAAELSDDSWRTLFQAVTASRP